jgi:hypothetical protein
MFSWDNWFFEYSSIFWLHLAEVFILCAIDFIFWILQLLVLCFSLILKMVIDREMYIIIDEMYMIFLLMLLRENNRGNRMMMYRPA